MHLLRVQPGGGWDGEVMKTERLTRGWRGGLACVCAAAHDARSASILPTISSPSCIMCRSANARQSARTIDAIDLEYVERDLEYV
jgi:hypothetical protein